VTTNPYARRRERDAEARAQGIDIGLAADKLHEAGAAMRVAEATVATAFELKREAEELCSVAGVEARVAYDFPDLSAVSTVTDLPAMLR